MDKSKRGSLNDSSDLTFITNEGGKTLLDRFNKLIEHCKFFDCMVGYFYLSGFYALYKSLENAERIRILIGIGTDKETFELIRSEKEYMSDYEVKNVVEELVVKEFDELDFNLDKEQGVYKFIDWIRSGKLQIKAYPSRNLHAKLYIITFKEGHIDKGRVITGSSNFTMAGLRDNLEFNVD